MKNFKSIVLLVSILGLAACGDNLDGLRPDAREQGDGPPMIDSPPGTPDADTTPDAGASTVTVTPGLCATPDHEITTMNNTFRLDGGAVPNPPLVFAVGDDVSIDVGATHNFVSDPAGGQFAFDSGAFGTDVCLTFTAAIALTDAVTYHCEMHATMTGTLVVN